MKGLTHPNFFPDISKIKPVLQPAIAGLICGFVSLYLPQVIGLGTESIREMIEGKINIQYAVYFLIFKLLLTVICLRMGLIGGVFAPALFIGASIGVILGFFFQQINPELDLNLLTVASMSAFASCVIGGPVANMMIILELTSDYEATLVAGLSIVFASLISYKVIGQSVFDRVLLNKKIDLKVGRENIKLQQIEVSEIAHQDYCLLTLKMNINDAIKKMVKLQKGEGYLVDNKNTLINKFELHILLNQPNKKYLKDLKFNKFLKLKTSSSVFQSIERCKNFVGESIPVLEENKKIFGVVTEGDLLNIYLKVSKEEKEHEHED
jgi:CIC family chloride channel protein